MRRNHFHEPQLVIDRLVLKIFETQELPSHEFSKNDTSSRLDDIGIEVDKLWAEYQEDAGRRNHPITRFSNDCIEYRDGVTAMTVAYFAVARILLSKNSSLTATKDPGSSGSSGSSDDHGKTVLDCARFLTSKNIGCAYLRMFFPLTLVAIHSSSSDQRLAACDLIESWRYSTSFGGLSLKALDTIHAARVDNELSSREILMGA